MQHLANRPYSARQQRVRRGPGELIRRMSHANPTGGSNLAHLLIRHQVQDFDQWQPAYDAHQQARAAAGLQDLHLWRNGDDPNDIFLLFEVADVDKARTFVESKDLNERMTTAGVT